MEKERGNTLVCVYECVCIGLETLTLSVSVQLVQLHHIHWKHSDLVSLAGLPRSSNYGARGGLPASGQTYHCTDQDQALRSHGKEAAREPLQSAVHA